MREGISTFLVSLFTLVNVISGACCGITVDSITFPLDTIKTRLQAGNGLVTVKIYKNLLNGLGTILMGSVPAAAIHWSIYEPLKKQLKEKTNGNTHLFPFCVMLAASVGNLCSSCIRNPFEVTKQFIQIRRYSNPVKAILAISKERGFKALYSGYGPMIMRDIPFDMIEYAIYEAEKRFISKRMNRDPFLHEYMLMGSIAGGIAAFLTCPLDVLKTRIMLSADLPAHLRHGVIGTFRSIIRDEGYTKMFSGVSFRVTWIAIGGAIWFSAFEEYKKMISHCF